MVIIFNVQNYKKTGAEQNKFIYFFVICSRFCNFAGANV